MFVRYLSIDVVHNLLGASTYIVIDISGGYRLQKTSLPPAINPMYLRIYYLSTDKKITSIVNNFL